jgi:hypothetical protein
MMQNMGRCIPNPVFQRIPFQNRLSVYSINYDFMPTLHNKPTSLWIDLKFPASDSSLQIGDRIILASKDPNFVPPPGKLKVIDIIGTRVILTSDVPLKSSRPVHAFRAKNDYPENVWSPLDHGGHWGNATRDMKALPGTDRNWTYGEGEPIAILIW